MVVSALEVAGNIAATVMTGGGAAAARVAIKGAIKVWFGVESCLLATGRLVETCVFFWMFLVAQLANAVDLIVAHIS